MGKLIRVVLAAVVVCNPLAASAASMPVSTMTGLRLLAADGIVTGTNHSNLITISGLDPASIADRDLTGLMYERLPEGFDVRLAQAAEARTLEVRDVEAERALYAEAVAAYDAAAAVKHEEVSRRVAAIEARQASMSANDLWQEARALAREAFWGADVAAEILKVRGWAREASAREALAREAAAMSVARHGDALRADDRLPAGSGPDSIVSGAAAAEAGALALGPNIYQQASLPARTKLDAQFAELLRANGFTLEDYHTTSRDRAVLAKEVTNFMAGIRASELSANLSQARLGRELRPEELARLPTTALGADELARLRQETGLAILGPAVNSAEGMNAKFDGVRGRLIVIRNAAGDIVATAAYSPYKYEGSIQAGIVEMETIAAAPSIRSTRLGLLLPVWTMQEASRAGYDTMFLDTRSRSMTRVSRDGKVGGAYPMYVRFGFLPSNQLASIRFANAPITAIHPEEVAFMMRGIRPEELASIPLLAPAD